MGQVKRRKARADRKEDVIRVRVTAEQHEVMQSAASLAGLDLSAWLRTLGYTEARRSVRAGNGP